MIRLFILLIITLFSCNSRKQISPNSNLFLNSCKLISKTLLQQTDVWNTGSIDGFMKGYWQSDSLKFITQRGIKFGYDSVAQSYKRNYNTPEKMGYLTFRNIMNYKTDDNYDVIQTTGNWHVKKTNSQDSGMFSLFFKQIKGEWKIIVDHTW